jgi:FKBP-type peptidyl-prolyl cis-trans isomerase SlyD
MVIENEKVISVSYELTVVDNGQQTVVEKTEDNNPFVFLMGTGFLLESFEKNLLGLKVGDKFDFVIDYKNGYGERDNQNIAQIPVGAFQDEQGNMDEEMVVVGNMLPMIDSEGNRINGVVLDVNNEFVKMDFNHPLAEKDLRFCGEVLNIRKATQEELDHGHVHGEGGVHHH